MAERSHIEHELPSSPVAHREEKGSVKEAQENCLADNQSRGDANRSSELVDPGMLACSLAVSVHHGLPDAAFETRDSAHQGERKRLLLHVWIFSNDKIETGDVLVQGG
ncbi:predicted protein [Histoplasma capsulatum G186AR]|uniref:Uncharacterized protein n=1 Tax=Ajellomyces capsulatus (strain G186AR / H82 / ATCC MYA-2454 / RMSCC 2432) TaxID=447093 RepID=C0P120_AJECG|nr:uncharacterized protein HCBG_09100 [Histoplasma capsulatum G186AR]EEH02656.1 predicted protein [Histoplasma capsulatum G186AR]